MKPPSLSDAPGLPDIRGTVNDLLAPLDGGDAEQLADAIAVVYEALAATPDDLLQDYDGFTENQLADPSGQRATEVALGRIEIADSGDPLEILLDAARLLRALEKAVLEHSRHIESDRGADLEDQYRTTDGRHYVIPRVTAIAGITGKPFLRRALLHHRVLPTRIGNLAIRLFRSPLVPDATETVRERTGGARNYGAAFFPGLTVSTVKIGGNSFRVDGVSGFDAATELADHVARARNDGCIAIIWPELTMPQTSVQWLRSHLAAAAMDKLAPFRFLLAGSWHLETGGQFRNVAQVLDGNGEPLFEIVKWAKFKLDGLREAIVPGREIPVLIGDGDLTVMAICRDFLQETKEVPYRLLNADVAIVPSMTASIDEVETLNGHAATAHTMAVRFGTRTMVVAQPKKPGSAGVGRVLAFPSKPQRVHDGELVEGAWRVCALESP